MENDSKKLAVELPFCGFYESPHDSHFDSWLESETYNLETEDGGTPEQVEKLQELYLKADWRAVHIAFAKTYADALETHLQEEGGRAIKLQFLEMTSPRFYNFETDRIYCDIAQDDLQHMLATVTPEAWAAMVQEKCTSRSGFISFHSNDASEWPDDLSEWGEARLGMLLTCYLMHIRGDKDEAALDEFLNWHLLEDIGGNGEIDSMLLDNAPELLAYMNGELYTQREAAEAARNG